MDVRCNQDNQSRDGHDFYPGSILSDFVHSGNHRHRNEISFLFTLSSHPDGRTNPNYIMCWMTSTGNGLLSGGAGIR